MVDLDEIRRLVQDYGIAVESRANAETDLTAAEQAKAQAGLAADQAVERITAAKVEEDVKYQALLDYIKSVDPTPET